MAESILDPGSTAGNADRSFSRRHSLRGRSNFLAVLNHKEAIQFRGRYCNLRHLYSTGVSESAGTNTKFGIMVSRRVGGAVRRNRLRRIIREYLRNNKRLWPSDKMIIIQLKTPIFDEDSLLAEIEDMLPSVR